MAVSTPAPDNDVVSLLIAALDALDRAGETIAAAYVSMALARVERQLATGSKG